MMANHYLNLFTKHLHKSLHATLAAGSLLLALPAMATDIGALRQQGNILFGSLPATMPGAEQDTPAQIALGKKLYFETALSVNGTQSCNSCHRVDDERAGVDNEPTSPGAKGQRGDRNSPTSWNAGFHVAQFWDGRAATLEEQAKGPILNPVEMAMPTEAEAVARLQEAGYASEFKTAFPNATDPLSYDTMARAIAAFERTLITRDRFDLFLNGDDRALTEAELKGMQAFVNTGCIACHSGATLGGKMYQKMGLVNPYPNTRDEGRKAVTGNPADQFVFKVPALRDISRTAPYFHDGSVATLEQAVIDMAWYQLGRKLNAEEATSIATFLRALEHQPASTTTATTHW